MKNIPLLLGTIVGTVVLIIVVATMFSGSPTTEQGQEIVDQALTMGDARNTTAQPVEVMQVTDPAQQDAEALATKSADTQVEVNQELVTIVEFSDFQCPACKASQPAVELVKANYPGKVQIVFRHIPLDSIHPNARLAAIASEAAASIDKSSFWGFHDSLFANQEKWSTIRDRQELKDIFATYATELGLDRTEFLERMEDNSIADLVNQDVSAATQLGINSTPTFYVNGIKTSAQQLSATVETILNN